jgi:hypothetical protein
MANAALMAKIAGAKASGGGNIIRDGNYTFEILNISLENKFKGATFVVDFKVIESEATDAYDDKGQPVKPNAVGSTCGYVVNLDKNVSAAGNAKRLILALVGKAEDEVTPEEFVEALDYLTTKAQPARGMRIKDRTFRKTIQSGPNAGKPFTGHAWEHVALSAEQIATNRAALDAAQKSEATK